MAFNAEQFRSSFTKPAQGNFFEIEIITRPPFIDSVLETGRIRSANYALFNKTIANMKFRCRATELPAKQLETIERRYHGPQRLVPYGAVYAPLNLEFIEDDQYSVRNFFDMWHEYAFSGGDYRPSYYDDIVSNFRLTVFDAEGKAVRSYTFFDAFPVSIAPSQLAWENNNSFVVIPVELSYHEFIGSSDTRESASTTLSKQAITNKIGNDLFGVVTDKFGNIGAQARNIGNAAFGSAANSVRNKAMSAYDKFKGRFS